jgi:monomeric sarcosine oxidase
VVKSLAGITGSEMTESMTGYDVVIIGAGIMGASAAVEAARRGAKAALLDQSSLPNPRAASVDHSKVFRFAYPDPLYARMAVDALALWHTLEEEAGERLMTRTGILLLGSGEDSFEAKTYDVLRGLGLEAELLAGSEVAARFPQFDRGSFDYAVFDPSGAILHAERAVRASIGLAGRSGVTVVEGERVASVEREKGGGVRILTERGGDIACARAIIASGPWTRALIPALAGKLRTTRQEVFYFEPAPPARPSFDAGRFPIFTALDTGFYGFPVHHAGAMKIANHGKGEPLDPLSFDPISFDGRASARGADECREFFARFLPALKDARLVEARVCIYNNTPDDDFIIDRHPELENVLVVTGFSGHGFKFGPLVGRISAELLLEGRSPSGLDRFGLARFENRAV